MKASYAPVASMSSGPTPAFGHAIDRPGLIVHVHTRLAAPTDDAADQCRRMTQVARAVRLGDDDRGRVVGFDAAVQQMQRFADDAAVQHIVHRIALLVVRLGVVGGVLGMHHLHHRHLLRLCAVGVHVPHERRREHLPRALPPVCAAVQHVAVDRRRRSRPGAADAHLGKAVHRAKDRDGLAQAGFHHADGDADQCFRRGPAAVAIHVEIQPSPDIARDEGRGGRVIAGI